MTIDVDDSNIIDAGDAGDVLNGIDVNDDDNYILITETLRLFDLPGLHTISFDEKCGNFK